MKILKIKIIAFSFAFIYINKKVYIYHANKPTLQDDSADAIKCFIYYYVIYLYFIIFFT